MEGFSLLVIVLQVFFFPVPVAIVPSGDAGASGRCFGDELVRVDGEDSRLPSLDFFGLGLASLDVVDNAALRDGEVVRPAGIKFEALAVAAVIEADFGLCLKGTCTPCCNTIPIARASKLLS